MWLPVAARCARNAQVALVFGTGETLGESATWEALRAAYPGARLVGCSTAGEIASGRLPFAGAKREQATPRPSPPDTSP